MRALALRSVRLRTVALAGAAAVLAVAGCAGTPDAPSPQPAVDGPVASPFEPCPPPATATEAGSSTGPGSIAASGILAGITLTCFDQQSQVSLAELGRPAVINLWASWCDPCRKELPELQRLADGAGDDLLVLGVVTEDEPARAASLAEDFHITFPAVLDPSAQVRRELGALGLPLTLFVAADGEVRHVHRSGVLELAAAAELTRTHLGVDVR